MPDNVFPSFGWPDDTTPARFATVRYNNPGGMYPGAAARAFGSTGTGVIGGGHLIANFPTPVHGAAANMQNIVSGGYVGMPIGSAISKWSGGGRGTVPGFDPNQRITPEMTRDPNFMVPFMKAVASGEAPGRYPMTDDQWNQAYTWYAQGKSEGPAAPGGYAGGGTNDSTSQGRKMPNSLMDMFQPTQQDNSSLGDRLAANSNSLIGLGMGLLQPYNPWAGTNAWTNALQGYQMGARTDAQRNQDARDFAFKQQQARLAQANFERTANRLEQSPVDQMLADLRKYAGTPQEEAVKNFYAKQTGGAWQLADVGVDAWNRPVKKWVNALTQEIRDINNPPPGAATAFGAGGGGAVPYIGVGPMGTGTQAPSATAAAPSVGAGGYNPPPMVTLPSGQVIPIPPGMDAKTFQQHTTQAAADVAAGKFTGEQAKAQLFANRMEVAKRTLDKLDEQGTSIRGGGIERLPGSDKFLYGNLLQTPDYQAYKTARDAFINALLRNESGAAISTGEYVKIEKEMFPQPGDGPRQIEAKRQLRDAALSSMKRAAGPGYQGPAPDAAPPTQAGSAGGASKAETLKQELLRRGVNPDQ